MVIVLTVCTWFSTREMLGDTGFHNIQEEKEEEKVVSVAKPGA